MYKDLDGVTLQNGDIIDINQTVNGESVFIVVSIESLDIRYASDARKYEYDAKELLGTDPFTFETTWKIVGNIR